MKHNDDDPVIFGYESSDNITFHGKDESGYTWGEWREMSQRDQNRAVDEYAWTLVDVYVADEDDEDE